MLLGRRPSRRREEEEIDRAAEERLLRAQMDRVEEEKRLALRDPGPSWREWWFYSASKWYVVLGMLIVDSWAMFSWYQVGIPLAGVGTLVGAVYAEFLLYEYLWYRPGDRSPAAARRFRRTWYRPVRRGRWTPEARSPTPKVLAERDEEGPDLQEFV